MTSTYHCPDKLQKNSLELNSNHFVDDEVSVLMDMPNLFSGNEGQRLLNEAHDPFRLF